MSIKMGARSAAKMAAARRIQQQTLITCAPATVEADDADYRSGKQELPAVFRDLLGEQMTKDINRALAAQLPAAERIRLEHAVAVAAVNQRKTRVALDAATSLIGRVRLMPYMTANDKASEVFHAAVTRLMELEEKD